MPKTEEITANEIRKSNKNQSTLSGFLPLLLKERYLMTNFRKYLKTDIFLSFILIVFIITGNKAINIKSTDFTIYILLITELTIFSAIFASIHLDINFTSVFISVNNRLNELDNTNRELHLIIKTLVKSIYLLKNANKQISGVTGNHEVLLRQYISNFDEYISSNIEELVENDIRSLNQ